MTRRVLTTIGSAAAVATAVGTCLLLAPTPQAQAATTIGNCTTGCVIFDSTTNKITAINGTKSAFVQFFSNMVCAGTSPTDQQCKPF